MRHFIPSWIRVPVVFFIIIGLVEYFVDSGDKPAFIEEPIVMLFLLLVLLILIAIEAIVESMNNILYQSLSSEAKAKYKIKSQFNYNFIINDIHPLWTSTSVCRSFISFSPSQFKMN